MVAALDEIRASIAGEIQTSIAIVNQTGLTLKRELERLLAAAPAPMAHATTGAGVAADRTDRAEPGVRSAASPDAVNAYKYVGFEDKFRGSESDISERLATYLPLFEGASDVLDLGCGRGEFLATLRDHGISGRGLDINHEMVELCHSRGLTVDEDDALSYLERLPDGSLGGLFAAQVVEHFQPGYLMRLLDVAYHALRPGSRLVLETLNPACWSAFFDSYIRDVTHAWPLHPDTLSFLVTAAGFQRIEVRYMAPYSPDHKMQRMSVGRDTALTPAEVSMMETFNTNVDRLNGQLFSNRDYAVIAERL
jgi:O-antigen chain-terminating methyltransferase